MANTRNEVSKCNNHHDIKQNIKSDNGRHVRIPEIVENKDAEDHLFISMGML